MNVFESAIKTRKSRLKEFLQEPLHWISEKASTVWFDQQSLDQVFVDCLKSNNILLRCTQVYAFDKQGIQVSSVISREMISQFDKPADLSSRPYFEALSESGMELSRTYTNSTTGESCITATHTVVINNQVIGYVAADFVLFDLPTNQETTEDRRIWLQVKGDPSIRGTLFMQSRTHSRMDEAIDDVLTITEELISKRGIFHAKLHFSSSRATLWLYDDPYHYRVHVIDELLSDALLAYPARDYPEAAVVTQDQVKRVFKQFHLLRNVDETVYLRAGSLNIINGMVALNFSCDGSHYIPCEEFLDKGQSFWLGSAGSTASDYSFGSLPSKLKDKHL